MKPVVGRFVLVAALFAGWMGWLTYLALTARDPVVVSQPQFLVADLTVVAHLKDRPEKGKVEVKVIEIHGPNRPASEEQKQAFPKKGETIEVRFMKGWTGWNGPKDYFIPLIRNGETFRLAPVPPGPTYSENALVPGWIYPVTDDTRYQVGRLVTEP